MTPEEWAMGAAKRCLKEGHGSPGVCHACGVWAITQALAAQREVVEAAREDDEA